MEFKGLLTHRSVINTVNQNSIFHLQLLGRSFQGLNQYPIGIEHI